MTWRSPKTVKSLFVGALLATAAVSPASAHCYGCNDALTAALIFGNVLGALSAPAPQPYVVVMPSPIYVPQPQPTYAEPRATWYCSWSGRSFPDAQTCPVAWSYIENTDEAHRCASQPGLCAAEVSQTSGYVSPPASQRIWWCRTSGRWFPDAQTCPVAWSR